MQTSSPEFQAIQRYFQDPASTTLSDAAIALGIGDDCALLDVAADQQLAISVDTSIANCHFPDDAPAAMIAARSLNIALSDLAAMGAEPLAFTLALSLPQDFSSYPEPERDSFLAAFSKGLFAAANQAEVSLIGGDTTVSDMPLSVSISVYGRLPKSQSLTRAGAKLGDAIFLSRATGLAACGLAAWQSANLLQRQTAAFIARADIQAYLNPQPELQLGKYLLPLANACIDVSDGLMADLSHILAASKLSAKLDCAALSAMHAGSAQASLMPSLEQQLSGGDDYALCFTVSEANSKQLPPGCVKLGQILPANPAGSIQLYNQPTDFTLNKQAYDHFC